MADFPVCHFVGKKHFLLQLQMLINTLDSETMLNLGTQRLKHFKISCKKKFLHTI